MDKDIKDAYGNIIGYRKWNDLWERYDIYDSRNNLVGYYKYNSLFNRWEYHKN